MGSSSCRRTWPCAIWARFRCRSVQPLRSPPSFVMLWRMIRLPCCRLRVCVFEGKAASLLLLVKIGSNYCRRSPYRE